MDEPSVLDYVKARLMPWRGPAPRLFDEPADQQPAADPIAVPDGSAALTLPAEVQVERVAEAPAAASTDRVDTAALPWASLGAFILALVAQLTLEPGPARAWTTGTVLYSVALLLAGWAYWRGEWQLAQLPETKARSEPELVAGRGLWVAVAMAAAAFYIFRGSNVFTSINLLLWLGSLALFIRSVWLSAPERPSPLKKLLQAARQPDWRPVLARWTLVLAAAVVIILWFRLYRLTDVPPQMVSDHAEKLLDVWDVLQGEYRVYFPRNTGREAIQMYLDALVVRIFDTGISDLTLKIGTVIDGLLMLPFMYLLGKELGSRRIGFLAVFFAGVGYWPNILGRGGLRVPLYPLFVAATLYFLIRGLRRSSRNDFLLAGLALGIGLHGYTPIRILPFVVLVAVGLFLLHRSSSGVRQQMLVSLLILVFAAVLAALPLLGYASANFETFGFRAFSRVGTVERPLPGPAGEIFLSNLWRALTMYAWDNGNIWLISVTNRPALDLISAALFYLGAGLVLVRYLRRRHWLDLFLLLAVPLLMLPSILSLAFPEENPALNRASGAMVPVFLLAAIPLDGLMTTLEERFRRTSGPAIAWALALLLLGLSAVQNYDLVFRQYQRAYELASWNTTEMGSVIRSFAVAFGNPEAAWVVPYPHWVDTRLVGMHAGFPTRDVAIWPERLADSLPVPGPKLFLLNMQDDASLENLRLYYPQGWNQIYDSRYENKDFMLYFVPPENTQP